MSTKKEIIIVRHGETDYNLKKIVQGRGVDSSLNSRGRGQAETFYRLHKHIPFDRVYASGLQRTHQTMKLFAEHYELIKMPALDEIDWGIHEGKKPDKSMHQEYLKIIDTWKSGNMDLRIDGGESPNDVQARMQNFVAHLQEGEDWNQVLVCCHGRAICILLCTLLGWDLTRMYEFKHSNLGSYKLVGTHDQWELEYSKTLRQINEEQA